MGNKLEEVRKLEESLKNLRAEAKEEALAEINKVKERLNKLEADFAITFKGEVLSKGKKRANKGSKASSTTVPSTLEDKEIVAYLEGKEKGISDPIELKKLLNPGRREGSIKKLEDAYSVANTKDLAGMREALAI